MTGVEVKSNLGKKVLYRGTEYYFNAYILRKKDGKTYHQAEIAEINGNTVYIVSLEKVEVMDSGPERTKHDRAKS